MELTHLEYAVLAKHYSQEAGYALDGSDFTYAAECTAKAAEFARAAMDSKPPEPEPKQKNSR